jgi:hypothetical protein
MKYYLYVPVFSAITPVGCYAVGAAALKWFREGEIREGGVSAQAEVVRLRKAYIGRGGYRYRVRYRLSVGDASGRQTYEHEGDVSGDAYDRLAIGQRVPAVYRADAPQEFRPVLEPRFGPGDVTALVVGLLVILVSGAALVMMFRRQRPVVPPPAGA